jgi:hypothetical protein
MAIDWVRLIATTRSSGNGKVSGMHSETPPPPLQRLHLFPLFKSVRRVRGPVMICPGPVCKSGTMVLPSSSLFWTVSTLITSCKTMVKVCLCITEHRPMKTYAGVELQLHAYLTSERDGGHWSTWRPLLVRNVDSPIIFNISDCTAGTRGSVVGWGITLQAGRSQVPFPFRSLDVSIVLILLAALWPWPWLNL